MNKNAKNPFKNQKDGISGLCHTSGTKKKTNAAVVLKEELEVQQMGNVLHTHL